jgi:hypothetical protein
VEFYRRLFGAGARKRRPGLRELRDRRSAVKLVLIRGAWGDAVQLNHLGVEVESTGEVVTETARCKREGFELRHEDGVTCCYALQDKFWVTGADSREWEIYTVLADAPATVETPAPQETNGPACCG